VSLYIWRSCISNSLTVLGGLKNPYGEFPERIRERAPGVPSRARRRKTSSALRMSVISSIGSSCMDSIHATNAANDPTNSGPHSNHKVVGAKYIYDSSKYIL